MSKNKWKINSIDLILSFVSLIIVLVLVNVFFFDKIMIDIEKKETVTLKIEFKNVSEDHTGLISEKDIAFISGDENKRGVITKAKVVDVPLTDISIAALSEEDEQSTNHIPMSRDVIIELQVEAISKGGKYIIGGTEYSIGDTIDLATDSFGSSAVIVDASKSED